ncbi:acylphosphatase [Verrucomicrobiales bacterium]|nr:acylphosphatase [Verrucomicrobiales bacterium]MDA7613680.1 acylphosphatase [Verrucomicrobiales bacterium]
MPVAQASRRTNLDRALIAWDALLKFYNELLNHMAAKQVFYEGRVQGVGFRYATKREAMGFDVCGWVSNLPDGRVEMQVMGDDDEVEDFLVAVREGQMGGNIRGEEIHDVANLEGVRGFSIR